MSFPRGVPLCSPQNPVFLPPFTVYLTASNGWRVVQPNGVYAPPGDSLFFFGGADDPYNVGEPGPGGEPNICAGNLVINPPAGASIVGMPLVIAFDQQAYRVADGKPSGTAILPPSGSGIYGGYARLVIPAGELLLMSEYKIGLPSQQAFICPAAYAQQMGWQITSFGG